MVAALLELLEQILELAKGHGRVTTIKRVTGESCSTIKARLKQLTADQLLTLACRKATRTSLDLVCSELVGYCALFQDWFCY